MKIYNQSAFPNDNTDFGLTKFEWLYGQALAGVATDSKLDEKQIAKLAGDIAREAINYLQNPENELF